MFQGGNACGGFPGSGGGNQRFPVNGSSGGGFPDRGGGGGLFGNGGGFPGDGSQFPGSPSQIAGGGQEFGGGDPSGKATAGESNGFFSPGASSFRSAYSDTSILSNNSVDNGKMKNDY